MENHTKEGESPVFKIPEHPRGIPSNARHGESRVNPARPWAKPKYSNLPDSGLVPLGNVEKNPGEGSEIEPEIIDLQAVVALCLPTCREKRVAAYLLHNGPASYCMVRA